MMRKLMFCSNSDEDDVFDSHAPLLRIPSRSLPSSPTGQKEARQRDQLQQRNSGFNLLSSAPSQLEPSKIPRKTNGQKFKLIQCGDVQILRLPPSKSIGNKLLAAKLLRKWETATIFLDEAVVATKEKSSSIPEPIPYADILEMTDTRVEGAGGKTLLEIKLRNSDSLLFVQTANSYQRDQWRYSIMWAATCHEFNRILSNARRPEALVAEIRKMVTYSMTLPIQDPVVTQFPLEVVSALIQQNGNFMERSIHENIIITLAPLLEDNHPSAELCNFFALHCRDSPRSAIVLELFAPVVARILKHNMDFGKSPRMRSFVQDYILALKDDTTRLEQFVSSIHGAAGSCPHPRILPNLASICFSALNKLFDEKLEKQQKLDGGVHCDDKENHNYFHCEPWKMMSAASLGSSLGTSGGGGGGGVGSLGCVGINNNGCSTGAGNFVGSIAETPEEPPVFEFLHGVPLAPSLKAAPSVDDVIVEEPASREENGVRGGVGDENDDGDDAQRGDKGEEEKIDAEKSGDDDVDDDDDAGEPQDDFGMKIACFCRVIRIAATFEDWRQGLGLLLQPVPFSPALLADEGFVKQIKPAVKAIAVDKRCSVHQMVLAIREGKEGWIQLFGPGGLSCFDDGKLFSDMLQRLLQCCCKRKKFLFGLTKMMGPCMLLALRENEPAIEVMCAMLELEVVENRDTKMQMITTLQSTPKGRQLYENLTEKTTQLQEMQSKGGPRKLTLPSKSTDADVARLLGNGTSFGNLECLSLAFTQVTSGCASHLAKLQNLRYLNLWSTEFGDEGLEIISDSLRNLQVLNLCETRVTDSSVKYLTQLTNLKKLNLNSTRLTPATYENLKGQLPHLQECDIRYTDAW